MESIKASIKKLLNSDYVLVGEIKIFDRLCFVQISSGSKPSCERFIDLGKRVDFVIDPKFDKNDKGWMFSFEIGKIEKEVFDRVMEEVK